MAKKYRADELLFAQNLAPSREMAKRLIMAGKVAIAPPLHNPKAYPIKVDKPGYKLSDETTLMLTGVERFVGRGAYKLLTAIEHFNIDVTGRICLDAGSSTGGFTDCLLQHGASKIYALDVGHDQLHERLRADPRVISMEGCNVRTAPKELIPDVIDMVVADVSFISLTRILPNCLNWLRDGGELVVLVKPQFELGPHQTDKGVVRDPALQQEAVDIVRNFCQNELHLTCIGVVPASIRGPKGNQEYLMCLKKGTVCLGKGTPCENDMPCENAMSGLEKVTPCTDNETPSLENGKQDLEGKIQNLGKC